MLRKSLLLLAALLFAAGANLRPVCCYELAGEPIAPGCGIRTAARAERAAQAAAEEILRFDAGPGEVTKHLRLSLRRPLGSARELSAALLAATPGIALRCEVRVDGRRAQADTRLLDMEDVFRVKRAHHGSLHEVLRLRIDIRARIH